jgi:hypothetical protein
MAFIPQFHAELNQTSVDFEKVFIQIHLHLDHSGAQTRNIHYADELSKLG